MTTLFFNNLTRNETDQSTIDVLIRKGWQAQPPPPQHDTATQRVAWSAETQGWAVIDKTAEEITAKRSAQFQPAENYQVRAWMIRGGLDPDLVPTIIAQVVPDGPERKEALMRWDYAVRVPRDFPLVDVIGAQMGLTPEQIDAAWPAILEL
jgi:hypothetical protein